MRLFFSGVNKMIKKLIHNPKLLSMKADSATEEDLCIAKDLIDTLEHYKATCVGMAANMIGENQAIIIFRYDNRNMIMFNPKIIKKEGEYETQEGCLSYTRGPVETQRYEKIKVRYQTLNFTWHTKEFQGFTAQIIQHEIDHLHGILI